MSGSNPPDDGVVIIEGIRYAPATREQIDAMKSDAAAVVMSEKKHAEFLRLRGVQ